MSYSKTTKIKLSTYDTQFSKIVRRDRNYTCEYCGRYDEQYVQAHHVIGRTNKRLRFDPENICLLCSDHHVFNHEFSAHRTPKDFREWFMNKYPNRWTYLNRVKNEKMSEYQAIMEFKQLTQTE